MADETPKAIVLPSWTKWAVLGCGGVVFLFVMLAATAGLTAWLVIRLQPTHPAPPAPAVIDFSTAGLSPESLDWLATAFDTMAAAYEANPGIWSDREQALEALTWAGTLKEVTGFQQESAALKPLIDQATRPLRGEPGPIDAAWRARMIQILRDLAAAARAAK